MMRILLADDQQEVRSALRLLLEYELALRVVGEAESSEELLAEAEATQPDLLLLDWELPGFCRPQEVLAALLRRFPRLKVIALSGREEARPAALASGVSAFVSKGDPPTCLVSLLRAMAGRGVPHALWGAL